MTIIDDLKTYKADRDISQEKLAQTLGVSWATVQRWLKGKSEPSALAKDRIKDLLKKK